MQSCTRAQDKARDHIASSEPMLPWEPAWLYVLLVVLGVAFAGVLIVIAGGPPTALAHFMYAPIILSAFRFGPQAGVLTGFLGGVIAGPVAGWAAIGSAIFTQQQITGWVIRDLWFAAVGLVLGAAFAYARHQAHALDVSLHVDSTTSLPNVRAATQYIAALRKTQREGGREVLLKALRVLNYQDLASTLGRERADDVMRVLGKRLRNGLPQGTFVSRTAQDTFTIIDSIAPGEPLDNYVSRVQGVDSGTLTVGDLSVYVDTALGVVRTPIGEADSETMLSQAEVAATKADGCDVPYRLYDPVEDNRRKDGVRLLGEVERAIREGELHLVYQPKLHLGSRRFTGLEALARWQHPTRGLVSPATFIPLVEQTHAIDAFTRWALREAIAQLVVWRERGYTPAVAVNISTRNLTSDHLLRYVHELLHSQGVAASSLELEITESALINLRASRLDLLRELQSKGVRIALDDFGTGYASLAYLRDLPIDILKLDQSFIRGGSQQRTDLRIVKRIVQMAKDLGLEVVAEGVEDAAMLRRLGDLGCDQAQGFFIAKPLPAERIEALLATGWGAALKQSHA